MVEKLKKSKKQSPVDEAAAIQQRIFEREVDEELQQEKLVNFWNKYRFLILGGVVAVLLSTTGYELYNSWWNKVRLSESDRYETAVVTAHSGEVDKAISQLEGLSIEGKTGYQYLAQMERAGLLISKNQKSEGLAILSELGRDEKAPVQLRYTAVLAYVGHQLETGNTQELQKLLMPILNSENESFLVSAAELSAVLFLRDENKKEAESILKRALVKQNISPDAKKRLLTLLSEIEG